MPTSLEAGEFFEHPIPDNTNADPKIREPPAMTSLATGKRRPHGQLIHGTERDRPRVGESVRVADSSRGRHGRAPCCVRGLRICRSKGAFICAVLKMASRYRIYPVVWPGKCLLNVLGRPVGDASKHIERPIGIISLVRKGPRAKKFHPRLDRDTRRAFHDFEFGAAPSIAIAERAALVYNAGVRDHRMFYLRRSGLVGTIAPNLAGVITNTLGSITVDGCGACLG